MASFWERARGFVRGQKAVEFSPEYLQYFQMLQTWAGKHITLNTALQVSTALACGRVIAEGIAMLPWKIMQKQGRDISPATGFYLYDKLTRKPNAIQSDFEFKEQAGLHLAFCGNAYIWAPRVSGRVDELYLFEPGWVRTQYQWPLPPTYEVQTATGPMTLSSSEVWHIRGPSFCSYVGLEFVHIARQALGLSLAIEEGQARIQGQGVQMPGYLSVDGKLTEDQHQKLKKWLATEHSGPEAAGRLGIVDNAAKFVSTSMSNVDAQTLEMRRFQIEEVCRFMRVLPIMVGHADKTQTYASAEQMFLAHATYTLGPWATRLESSIGRWLLTDRDVMEGYYPNVDEKVLLRMTSRDQSEVLARLSGAGIYTRNEARELLDRNPLAGLDEPLTPMNVVAGEPPRADNPPTDVPPAN